MTRFYATNTTAAVSALDADIEYSALSTASVTDSGSGTHLGGVAAGAIEWTHIYWGSAEQAHNSATWPTDGYGVSVDVTQAGSDLTYSVELGRITSDGATLQAGSPYPILVLQTGAGIKTSTGQTIATINVTPTNIADRLFVSISGYNANMMTNVLAGVRFLDTATWCENTNFTPPLSDLTNAAWGFVPL